MEKLGSGTVEFYKFDILKEFSEISHGVFTRRGGESLAPFQSLNVSYHTGDHEILVRRNRAKIKAIVGAAHLVSAHQVHRNRVKIIDHAPLSEDEPQGFDALLTNIPDVALLIKQADCQAIILYDMKRKVIGNVHCGWRGNVANIIGDAVGAMVSVFGCTPQDMLSCIGPSLGPCCAEFDNFRRQFPPSFWQYEVTPGHFDLWAISRDQLLASGILLEHIELAGICTRCRQDDFFSYRAEKVTGRFGTVIALSKGGIN